MTIVTTRIARAADAAQIAAMIKALGAFHNDQATIEVEDLIFLCFGPSPWMTLIVAERDGRLLGYAALQRKVQLQFARRLMDVQHLFVKDAMRGQGVGRALIEASAQTAKAQRCKGMTLGVMAQNTQAQAFYARLGFVQSETSGALQMLLPLASNAALVKPEHKSDAMRA